MANNITTGSNLRQDQLGIQNRVKLVFRLLTLNADATSGISLPATAFLQGVTTADIVRETTIDDDTGLPTTVEKIDVRAAIPNRSPAFTPSDDGKRVVHRDPLISPLPYILDEGTPFFIMSGLGTTSEDDFIERSTFTGDTIFTFYVNPLHIAPSYRKSRTQMKTLGGWEVQHWGNELTELAINGTSGGMHRVNDRGVNQGLTADQTVRDSTAWKKLEKLRLIYLNDHALRNKDEATLWSLEYQGRVYVGSFSSFTGPEEDGNDPFQLKYSFTFVVEDERVKPVRTTNPIAR